MRTPSGAGPGAEDAGPPRSLALAGETTLVVSRDGDADVVRFVGSRGEVALTVRVGPDGPVLRLEGESLRIEAAGRLAVRCASFAVEADDIALHAGAGLALNAGGDARLSAQAVAIEGRRGEIALEANDDVVVNGERVLLNCPTDEEVARRRAGVRSLAEALELPFTPPGSPRRMPASAPVDDGTAGPAPLPPAPAADEVPR